jgi:hypothetical protein
MMYYNFSTDDTVFLALATNTMSITIKLRRHIVIAIANMYTKFDIDRFSRC